MTSLLLLFVFTALSPLSAAFEAGLKTPSDKTYQQYLNIFDDTSLTNTQKQQQGQALLFELDPQQSPQISALIYIQLLNIAAEESAKIRFDSLKEQLATLTINQNDKTTIDALLSMAEINLNRKMGKHPLAILQAENLLQQIEQQPPVRHSNVYDGALVLSVVDHAYLYYLLGNSFFLSAEYATAHKYLLLAMDKYEQVKNLPGQAVIYTNLSMISWAQGNFPQAIFHTNQALDIANNLNNEAMLINNLLNKGIYFQNSKKYDNALSTFRKLLSHPNIKNYPLYQIKALLAKADTIQSTGMYEQSRIFIENAIQIATEHDDLVNLNTAKISLGNLLTQQKKYEQALPHYLEAEAYFEQMQLSRLQSVALKETSKMYQYSGQFDKALDYFQQFHALNEKMLKNAQKSTVLSLQEKFLAESKTKQIELLKKQQEIDQVRILEVEQQRQITLIASTAIIIILLLLISRYFTRKESKNLKQLNQTIIENESQLTLLSHAFRHTSDGVWIVNANFELVAVNNAFVQHTHKTRHQVIGKKLAFAAVNGQDEMLAERILLQTKLAGSWQGELFDQRSNDEIYPIELEVDAIVDDNANVTHYLGIFRDVTDKRRTQEQLSRLATHDELTGLANRTLLEELVSQSCLTAQHTKKLPTLLLVNVNGFKKINDSLGHSVGDKLIVAISKRLKSQLFSKDIIARLSGAEFCVLCELNDPRRSAVRVAQKVMETFDQVFNIDGHQLNISANMGITIYPQDAKTSDELLRKAAIAMLDVSNSNNIGYRFFEPKMNTSVTKQLEREQKILNAINNQYFEFYYQPIVDISSKNIVGAEALIRWVEPDGTVISPANFIPVAEQAGFIDQIDRIVIAQVFSQAAVWKKQGYDFGVISLNLSAQMFLNAEELITMLTAKMSQNQVAASNFKLEITEGMLLGDIQRGIKTMRDLKGLGFQLSLDDFGTGYSSLNYLKKFPIDCLKIDRSFISSMHKNKMDQEIVASIISLAHTLGITVVAEGVEYEEHLQLLAAMQCELYQGFYFSQPVPAETFEVLLTEKSMKAKHQNKLKLT
ncbi:EAL domain-containing protein [Thalassotalea marina]|uniref:EAL domain-containing protein n=1 Tax=Thalassotalea marina TaxID=1673741 RepID=UPI001673D01E|nr:EAL domain-containing protein [Thalassotalea marina]